MKKILLLLIITLFSLTIISCTDENINKPLRVGMDLRYPPFETTKGTTNTPEGISVDLAYAFGEFLGREVKIINTNFASIIPALNAGSIDVAIASMSITEERKQSVEFSDPYFYFKIISLVNKSFAEANNVTENTTVSELLAIESARYVGLVSQVSATIPQSHGKTVTEATDLGTAIESVAQGLSDILLMSPNPVVNGQRANPQKTMVVWDAFDSSPIGMAIKKGNIDLLNKANEFIGMLSDEGGVYEDLANTWDAVLLENLGKYGLEFYINK